jgi:hypothetical protein
VIVALLLALLAAWFTWLLFRDDDSVDKRGDSFGNPEAKERDRGPRAGK